MASLFKFTLLTTATSFLVYENVDNARGGSPKLLGTFDDASACEAACVDQLGGDPTGGCASFTYFHADYAPNGSAHGHSARQCYGSSTGYWVPWYSDMSDPTFWGNVTSGQNNPTLYKTPCKDAADCSYNGQCNSNGYCDCFSQWMGNHCGQLNLVPTKKDAGFQSSDAGGRVSSWGGSVVRGDDGTYHMYTSEMINNCGIVVWMSNSIIRHAVSRDGPLGPYHARDVAEGLWGHEPTVARAPTGEYVLFWTAHFGDEVPCSKVPCPNGDNGNSVIDGDKCLADTQCKIGHYVMPRPTYMAYASEPAGPWSEPVLIPAGDFGSRDTNLAPIILEDGSLIALGRPPWVWRATDWKDNTTYTVTKAESGTIIGEDPFLYIDSRNRSILHAVSHAGGWDSSGGHVWSVDGGKSWQRHEDVRAYSSLIMYDDGTYRSLSRRERPHLVFDEAGEPIALTAGVTNQWPCTHPEVCPKDHCYTALQALQVDPAKEAELLEYV